MRAAELLSWVGRSASAPANLQDFEQRARRRLPRMIMDFVEGGAEGEQTVRANRDAFDRWALVPRVLVDVATRDLRTMVLGTELTMPIALAPTGLARLVHLEGEVAAARAASRAGTAFTLSTGSSRSIEEVALASGAGAGWFQLYLWRDKDVIAGLIRRARDHGYRALVLTVDVPLIGRRERDVRNGMSLPPRITPANALHVARRPRWLRDIWQGEPVTFANFTDVPGRGRGVADLARFVNVEMMNPAADWSTLDWVRAQWDGPLAVKGVLHPDDARQAVDRGATAIVVSNHGGRQLDAAVASLDALPAIVDAVGARAEVLLDGGIRRGTDVLKAMALGAKAVLIGRSYLYGLAVSGERGVVSVVELLREELDRSMALCGLSSLNGVEPSLLYRTGATSNVK